MAKIPIFKIEKLIDIALKNDGALTSFEGVQSKMVMQMNGISINSKPRKDGRFQGYIVEKGVKKYVYAKSKEEVAEKIVFYLKNGIPKTKKADTNNNVPTTFNAFALYYFKNFRKRKVSYDTYRVDLSRYNNYLKPYFNEKPIKKITAKECQDLLDKVLSEGKGKTADELRSILSVIFKTAIKHYIINKNPLDMIFYQSHEKKSGTALSIEEERLFRAKISVLSDERLRVGFSLMLFTGLRPNELKTAYIKDGFVVAQNSKRKNKKVEYKKIPVINGLKPFVENGLNVKFSDRTLDKLRSTIKLFFPNHILYDLRHTFYTRCCEYGVSNVARDYFVGHSAGVLSNTYTNLSDEYLLKEASKLDKW